MFRFVSFLRVVSAVFLITGIARVTVAEVPARVAGREALQAILPTDTRLETLTGGYVLLIPEPFAPPIFATDPHYAHRTSRALSLYERHPVKDSLTRRVVVHFEEDDRISAIRSARLIARLLFLHRERLGRETVLRRGAGEAHVWLIPLPPGKAAEGGETRDNNVYVFAASAITSPIELARTVAHEWGHETLPAARGFAEPENDASGYLGERLYMHYLNSDTVSATEKRPDDGTTAETLLTYHDRQVKPLIARFEKSGPHSPLMDGDGTEAMDYYIGAVLTMAETIGSPLLGEALFGIDDTSPRDFVRALETSVAKKLPDGVFVTMRAWLPLARGTYVLTPVSGGGAITLTGPQSLRAVADGPKSGLPKPRPGEKRDGTFRVTKPGWFRLTASGSLSEFTIRSVGTAK